MSYTAIVFHNASFYTHFQFSGPHDKPAAFFQACNIWKNSKKKDDYSKVVAIIPGSHEAWTPYHS